MRLIGWVALWVVPFLVSCVSSGPSSNGAAAVRRLDFKETPELEPLAERAETLANEVYPKIVAALSEGAPRPPKQFDLVFKRRLTNDNLGLGGSSGVWLNGGYFAQRPEMLESVLVHELVHVAQSYVRSAPSHWTEGLADYVRIKLGYTNGTVCAGCSTIYPHYRSGYECTAAFLLFVDDRFGPEPIHRLDDALRKGRYTDEVFVQATGRKLEDLWREFRTTAAFSKDAAALLGVQEALGFVDGQPPPDLESRLRRFPRGSGFAEAGQFLRSLVRQHRLPGFAPGEKGKISMGVHSMAELVGSDVEAFPRSRSAWAKKTLDPSTYHYRVVQDSKDGPWRMAQAWKTDPHGRVVVDFPINQ